MPPRNPTITPGAVLDEVDFDIEAGKVREFVRATQTADPVHTDAAAARAAGFPTVPATATHVVVAGHHRNQAEFVAALGLDISRIVVGSVHWEYRRPALAGDHLTGTRRVVDDTIREGRSGGPMRLVTLETTWVDDTDEPVVVQREVLIERGA